jgi:hypothetical protein
MAKQNITRDDSIAWNRYATKPPADALPLMYDDALADAKRTRGWYWQSIRNKRRMALIARALIYVLTAIGLAAPLMAAALAADSEKLAVTQIGVCALALAAFVQVGDRVFGWSTGWLRYMTTVMTMERLTAEFQQDWAAYLLSHVDVPSPNDVRALFELAKRLGADLRARTEEETAAWVTEFNAGMAALTELIKTQRSESEKAEANTRTLLEARTQQARTGSIQLAIAETIPQRKPFKVFVNGELKQTLNGNAWSEIGLTPGQYKIRVAVDDGSEMPVETSAVAVVTPDETTALELRFA